MPEGVEQTLQSVRPFVGMAAGMSEMPEGVEHSDLFHERVEDDCLWVHLDAERR